MRGGRVVSVLVMPVGAGIIKRETEPVLFTSIGKHFQHVLAVRGVHYIVVGLFGIPHTEAVVVLGGKADILHSRGFCKKHPFLRIVFHGVEARGESLVLIV